MVPPIIGDIKNKSSDFSLFSFYTLYEELLHFWKIYFNPRTIQ